MFHMNQNQITGRQSGGRAHTGVYSCVIRMKFKGKKHIMLCNVKLLCFHLHARITIAYIRLERSLRHANIHGFYNRNSSKTLPRDIYRGKNQHDLECFSAKLHFMNNNMMWIQFAIADDTKPQKSCKNGAGTQILLYTCINAINNNIILDENFHYEFGQLISIFSMQILSTCCPTPGIQPLCPVIELDFYSKFCF